MIYSKLLPAPIGLALGFAMPCHGAWEQVWNDEFDGSALDANRWTYDIGNGYWSDGEWISGWGNNELEYYTSRTENVYVSDGLLHLSARNESYNGFSYTSGRVKSYGLFSKKYGRFEFRARLPQGQGFWPALWLLPDYPVFPRGQYGNWAASGEIDTMESRGSDPTRVDGTIFYGGEWPNQAYSTQSYLLPGGGQTTDFHTYALEWNTNSLRWYVDGQLFKAETWWWSSGGPFPAPFDQPFYIIMNLAVGGDYGGNPNPSTVFPGELQVDYVRVYVPVPDQPATITLQAAGGEIVLNWSAGTLQSAPDLSGPWNDVPGATSPRTNPASVSREFYRLRFPAEN
jgi:beta-glucanase (GH16 family)